MTMMTSRVPGSASDCTAVVAAEPACDALYIVSGGDAAWLDCALSELSLDGWLCPDGVVDFLLSEGIAPGQEFTVEMEWGFDPGDGWERDADAWIDFEIVSREPLSLVEHGNRWADWLAIVPVDADPPARVAVRRGGFVRFDGIANMS